MFFVFLERKLIWTISIPSEFNFKNPILSQRKELPTHDFYSFFAGICVIFFSMPFLNFVACLLKLGVRKLRRSNAIKRSRTGLKIPSNISLLEQIRLFWYQKGRNYIILSFRCLYIVVVVGLIIPLLLGVIFDMYVITPIQGTLNKAPIFFLLLDWSTGAMAMRIAYHVLAMTPERRINRVLTQANVAGVAHMNLNELTEEIFLPILIAGFAFLSLPLLSKIIDYHFGICYLFDFMLIFRSSIELFIPNSHTKRRSRFCFALYWFSCFF